jgi:diacylglycerol kinase family enzyme
VIGGPVPRASGRPAADRTVGEGLAILINANAKRGGRRVAAQIARALPGAHVRVTRSAAEIDAWLRMLPPTRAVLAAGGDGTAIALVNALARVTPEPTPLPVMGVLPLGTGNAWAHALGAPKLHRCLQMLAKATGPLPTREFGLVEVEGTLSHFAGSGWDAMILDDYKRQLAASRWPGRRLSKSVYGYLLAALVRTTPKVLLFGNPHLVIENLGDEVYGADEGGRPHLLQHVGRGAILYDGPAGAASAGTCPEYGYRFKAFPFAERMPGFINVRVYTRGFFDALTSVPRLWRGEHPIAGMHDWFAKSVRMTFSRPVPLQVAGDAHGTRQSVEYRAARRNVKMADWRRMSGAQGETNA